MQNLEDLIKEQEKAQEELARQSKRVEIINQMVELKNKFDKEFEALNVELNKLLDTEAPVTAVAKTESKKSVATPAPIKKEAAVKTPVVTTIQTEDVEDDDLPF